MRWPDWHKRRQPIRLNLLLRFEILLNVLAHARASAHHARPMREDLPCLIRSAATPSSALPNAAATIFLPPPDPRFAPSAASASSLTAPARSAASTRAALLWKPKTL